MPEFLLVRDLDSFHTAVSKVEENFSEFSTKARKAYVENFTPEKNYSILKTIYGTVIEQQKQKEAGESGK